MKILLFFVFSYFSSKLLKRYTSTVETFVRISDSYILTVNTIDVFILCAPFCADWLNGMICNDSFEQQTAFILRIYTAYKHQIKWAINQPNLLGSFIARINISFCVYVRVRFEFSRTLIHFRFLACVRCLGWCASRGK